MLTKPQFPILKAIQKRHPIGAAGLRFACWPFIGACWRFRHLAAVSHQSIPEWEQGLLAACGESAEGNLVYRTGPGVGQFAAKWPLTEQDVGHALPLGTGQPGRDKDIPIVQVIGHDQRATGQKEDDELVALLWQALQHALVGNG